MKKMMIDTSIILEPFTPENKKGPNYKRRCLALLKNDIVYFKNNFLPVISLSILGELHGIINEKKISWKKETMNEIINEFFGNCLTVGITRESIDMANCILKSDERLDPLDILHLSCAICNDCETFMTLDSELIKSEFLRKFIKEREFYLTPFNIHENKDR
ncbi:MAG: type II toxin-antitoxin system VapC family toxin [Nanoarchaeota archaeon]|nr:type II toxin-antitoxin system VapC family toxin [Nanoarchaeota archaeon]